MPRRSCWLAAVVPLAVLMSSACGSGGSPTAANPAATVPRPATSTTAPAPTTTATTAPLSTYDSTVDPAGDIAQALTLAAADHKEVLIDFGADWCPDCQVLASLYQSPEVRTTLDAKYHLVAVDVGEFDKNLAIDTTYGDPIKGGIPALVVLSGAGKVVTTTKDGSFANARTMKPPDVLSFLQRWASEG